MPSFEGKMLVCSRCGKEVFLKKIGEREVDAGYSPNRIVYEDMPEEWMYESEMGGYLCNDCADIFKEFVTDFMNGNVAPAWKHKDWPRPEEVY